MYSGLASKNGFSVVLVVIAVSVGVAGAVSVTAGVSVLEQPAKVNTSAVPSASVNVDFINGFPFFWQKAIDNFTSKGVLMPHQTAEFVILNGD
jgi:hypothetical protein